MSQTLSHTHNLKPQPGQKKNLSMLKQGTSLFTVRSDIRESKPCATHIKYLQELCGYFNFCMNCRMITSRIRATLFWTDFILSPPLRPEDGGCGQQTTLQTPVWLTGADIFSVSHSPPSLRDRYGTTCKNRSDWQTPTFFLNDGCCWLRCWFTSRRGVIYGLLVRADGPAVLQTTSFF